jgi:glycosyltransferase involved in cell wall biosynthesis
VPDVSVIVPARDSAATLPRTLAHLAAQDFAGAFEVVVVDDGSRDGTRAVAEAAGAPVRCISQPPSGPGAARNAGVAAGSGAILAFTDADCYPPPGWLTAGVAALEGSDLVQGAVRPREDQAAGPFDRTLWVVGDTGLWQTANLFTRRDLFDRVGGFQDWLHPRHGKILGEDVKFGWDIARTGARTAFDPDVLVHHEVFPRSARGYVEERRRLEHFPELARKVPELRETMFWRRVFLSRRTARFDLALLGVGVALARRSPLPLLAAAPFLRLVAGRALGFGRRRAPAVAAVDMAADAVGLVSLARGSIAARTPLL